MKSALMEQIIDPARIGSEYSSKNAATIYNGPCLDLLDGIRGRPIQLVFTSPPYNIGKRYGKKSEPRLDIDTYVEEQATVIAACVKHLSPTGSICWQVGNHVAAGTVVPLDIVLYPAFIAAGLVLRNRVIWGFDHGLHCNSRLSGRYETVLWWTFPGNEYKFNLDSLRVQHKYPAKRHFRGPKSGELSGNPKGKNPGDRWSSDVWEIPNVKANHVEKTDHPCQFPVALVERFVLALSEKDDLVFDPYAGAGTCAVAAVRNGRRALTAETVAKYTTIAKRRLVGLNDGTTKIRDDKPPLTPSGKLTLNPWRADLKASSPQS